MIKRVLFPSSFMAMLALTLAADGDGGANVSGGQELAAKLINAGAFGILALVLLYLYVRKLIDEREDRKAADLARDERDKAHAQVVKEKDEAHAQAIAQGREDLMTLTIENAKLHAAAAVAAERRARKERSGDAE